MMSLDVLETTLRRTLNHLYDPAFLRDSPLVDLLHLDRENGASALHSAIEHAIEELGQDQHPATARANRRHYEVLFNRYLQQFTQEQVAHQLGVSPRHLRRQQFDAIRALSEYLRVRYGLRVTIESTSRIEDESDGQSCSDESVDSENAWLGESRPDSVADVDNVLREAVATARSLAEQRLVQIGVGANAALPQVAMDPRVLKQVVLNLLAALIGAVPGGAISVAARAVRDRVIVSLSASPSFSALRSELDWDQAKVAKSSELAMAFGGDVTVARGDDLLTFAIHLPSTERIRVLAIEDNEDTLQLWSRYVEHTRFSLIAARESQRALDIAIEQAPDLVVLDVMMPALDGWDLLAQIQRHPALKRIPVIICTVLPQRELALSLGANDFVVKPTTRQSFLEALRRQTEASEP